MSPKLPCCMRRWAQVVLLAVLFVVPMQQLHSRAGCCSRQGGVCGRKYCEGSPLSAKYAPNYPSCGGSAPASATESTKPKAASKSQNTKSVAVQKTKDQIIKKHLPFGQPIHDRSADDDHILYRDGYVLGYNDDYLIPNWVCYHLSAEDLKGSVKRTNDFRPDPDLQPGHRAELADYDSSRYDRGQMAPADDMVGSQLKMSQSFLLSNIVPQDPAISRGIWKQLEDTVRSWAKKKGNVDVCTGPLVFGTVEVLTFDQKRHVHLRGPCNMAPRTTGPDKVVVPASFYKIVLAMDKDGTPYAIAFVIPNETALLDSPLSDFIVPINLIQGWTGLDFFTALDDSIEGPLEAGKADHLWN